MWVSNTFQQLLLFFHKLVTSIHEVEVIYIDFHKAFDCVPHKEVLVKLWALLEISGNGLLNVYQSTTACLSVYLCCQVYHREAYWVHCFF